MNNKLKSWLIQLYPATWQQQYGQEFSNLLDQCLNSPLEILDVILGALDAHLHLFNENDLNWRIITMNNKLRTSILLVFCAFIGFVIAGLTFNGMIDDSPFIALMHQNVSFGATYLIIEIGAVIALLAVATGGLPIAITLIRRAITSQRRDLRLLLVPVISFLLFAMYIGFILAVGLGWLQIPGLVHVVTPGQPFPAGNRFLMLGLMAVFIAGAVASSWTVWRVVSRLDEQESSIKVFNYTANIKLYKFAFPPAVISTFAMVVMLIACGVWSSIANSALPQFFHASDSLWGLNPSPFLIFSLALMLLATCLSIAAVVHALPAYHE